MHKGQAELFERLIRGPLPHNALSRDVFALFEHLGAVEEHGHDKLLVTIGAARQTFGRPKGKHLSPQELSEIRHFLLASALPEAPPLPDDTAELAGAMVVVIDHHKARFYRTTGGSRPEAAGQAAPADPHGFHRHLIHRKEANYQGDRVPEDPAFYNEVAQTLKGFESIILVGHGTGKSNAAAYLQDYLAVHHTDIAARIISAETVDLSALSEPEIEALAESQL